MNVLFLEKNLREIDKLGPLYIARVLKDNGHNVDLLQTDYDDPFTYILNNKVDWVMFSIMTGQESYVRRMSKAIKNLSPSIRICVGGPHVTFDLSYPDKEPNVDVFIRGPGELVINDIVESGITGDILIAPYPDIDSIPTPYRNIMYKYPEFKDSPIRRFITMRGCPHNCSYCFNCSFKDIYKNDIKKFLSRRDPEKVIDEILEVKREFGLGYVYFNDDNFSIYPDWVEAFCKLYKKEVSLPFGTGMRADTVDYNLLKMLRDAGMVFTNFALETKSEDLQRNLLNRGNVNNNQIIDAVKHCKELGIKTRILNMIGLPIENPLEEALDTLEFNKELYPTDSWAAIFQPYPYTKLYEYSIEHGYLDPDKIGDDPRTFYESSVLNIKDKEKIEMLQKWWFFFVRYKVDPEFVKLLIGVPLTKDDEMKITQARRDIARDELYV